MAWYDEAVFYHIYPLGMLGAPKDNDYGEPVHRLRELDEWIEHIANTGFNAIYIGPLFESVGHGYETTDYKKLDSRLGDNEDLKAFVKKCHGKNIRVVFDGVFNHTGRDFFAFRDIVQNRENSPYRDWYCNVNFYGNNEYNDGFSYDNWGGYNLLAKLNQRNTEVKNYICDVIRFWVSEFDVDGIRLDAADVLDFDFMKTLRSVANEVKPDFWLMGEVIHGDYTRWVNEGTLHCVTNYALHKAFYSGHNDHNYFEIAHTVKRLYDMGGNRPDGLRLYNFVDNHDVERIFTKLNNKAHFVPVHILLYSLPGIPSVYYGSEFGIEGKKEKFSDASLRPALRYEDYSDAAENNSYTRLIAALGRIRNSVKILSYGDYREITLTNRQFMFARQMNGRAVIVVVNNDEAAAVVNGRGLPDGNYTGALSGNRYSVCGGNISVEIPAASGDILVPEDLDGMPEIERVVDDNPVEEVIDDKPVGEVTEAADTVKNESGEPVVEEMELLPDGAGKKYGIDAKYDKYNPDELRTRTDYENMCVEELQVAILEKMSGNGYVDSQMIKSVMDNVYEDSLRNWVKSFR